MGCGSSRPGQAYVCEGFQSSNKLDPRIDSIQTSASVTVVALDRLAALEIAVKRLEERNILLAERNRVLSATVHTLEANVQQQAVMQSVASSCGTSISPAFDATGCVYQQQMATPPAGYNWPRMALPSDVLQLRAASDTAAALRPRWVQYGAPTMFAPLSAMNPLQRPSFVLAGSTELSTSSSGASEYSPPAPPPAQPAPNPPPPPPVALPSAVVHRTQAPPAPSPPAPTSPVAPAPDSNRLWVAAPEPVKQMMMRAASLIPRKRPQPCSTDAAAAEARDPPVVVVRPAVSRQHSLQVERTASEPLQPMSNVARAAHALRQAAAALEGPLPGVEARPTRQLSAGHVPVQSARPMQLPRSSSWSAATLKEKAAPAKLREVLWPIQQRSSRVLPTGRPKPVRTPSSYADIEFE